MNKISVKPLHTGTVAASGSWSSEAIDLAKLSNEHKLSLQYVVTGDGTATIDILASNDGINYVDTGTDVEAALDKSGGPGSDGIYAIKNLSAAMLPYCRFFKVRVTETGTANSVTIAMALFVQ